MLHTIPLIAFATCLSVANVAWAGDWRNGYSSSLRDDTVTRSANFVQDAALPLSSLEKNFNWCTAGDGHPALCTASWNQHIPQYCGACWAHGTLSAIQDRLKIKKGGLGMDVMLARQVMLNCGAFDKFGSGCNGGDVIDVFHYMTKHGLPDESCQIYNATDHTKYKGEKSCPKIAQCMNCMSIKGKDTCWAVAPPILYKLKSFGKLDPSSELDMMTEIRKNGPITCSISTPEDMIYNYRGEILRKKDYTISKVDHDVEVVGWGEEDGVPFWHVRNSWGTYWGELGFFRLERGTNALHIEEADCWAADPEYQDEQDVRDGRLKGSMYGLVDSKARGPDRADIATSSFMSATATATVETVETVGLKISQPGSLADA